MKIALTVIAFVVLTLVTAGWLVGLVSPAIRPAATIMLLVDLALAVRIGWVARGDCAPTRSTVCLCGGCHKDEEPDDDEPDSAPQGHCCQGCSGGCGGSRL